MPSRKKAKGKARKAAKEAKEEESRAVVNVAANQRQERSLTMQMQRLRIKVSPPTACRHDYPLLSDVEVKIFEDFINAFSDTFISQNNVAEGFITAQEVTEERYPSIYSSKLEVLVSILLSRGTQMVLEQDNSKAQVYAMLAFYFEDYLEVEVRKTRGVPCPMKLLELKNADDHTLVSFYKKRIPCSCLDKKYKEVKSVNKRDGAATRLVVCLEGR